ncbi:AAA family ATPase [Streptomyces xiaopingdaonensis]|uniref:AAA family ATPase n=1 Tax=Streptomyces xiaopingdaonensis TaxID=1565415 RepID=UPI0002FB8CE1|nr:AAA family ATPase [Streptomyces xiaopingdaonensis]
MESLRSGHPAGGGAASASPEVPSEDAGPELRCRDLRGSAERRTLRFPAGDLVVVSGLPGSGKSTLIGRAVRPGRHLVRIDSQDVREDWARRVPSWLPYALYRPLVRLAHYAALHRALASGSGAVVHACGAQAWVLRWISRAAVRGGRGMHLLLLDVAPGDALLGQAGRGRRVSAYAFLRHRRAVARLIAGAERGRMPWPCVSVVLLDRRAAACVRRLAFGRRREAEPDRAGRLAVG